MISDLFWETSGDWSFIYFFNNSYLGCECRKIYPIMHQGRLFSFHTIDWLIDIDG